MIRLIFSKLKGYCSLILFKMQWIQNNKHNSTIPANIFGLNQVHVGNYTYGKLDVHTYGNSQEKLEIGHFCSIGGNVMFLLGGNHPYNHITTFPIKRKIFNNKIVEATSKGPIKVESDVWIGERSTILSGVTIGQGAIIGAGSIVSKDIPPYAVYVGNKIIKYRFAEAMIENLIQIDFGLINKDFLEKNLDLFYQNIDRELLENPKLKALRKNR